MFPSLGGREGIRSGHAQQRNAIGQQLAVLGNQYETLDHGLGNEEAVERIGVMQRQRAGGVSMSRCDVQSLEAGAGYGGQPVPTKKRPSRHSPDPNLPR